MRKKTREKKEVAELRRQIEALKAELKIQKKAAGKSSKTRIAATKTGAEEAAEYDIGADIKKTILLTIVSLAIIVIAFLNQKYLLKWF